MGKEEKWEKKKKKEQRGKREKWEKKKKKGIKEKNKMNKK